MPPVIMTSPKDDGQAHQISVTRPVFEYLGKLLRITISFPLSTRHNAMYGFDDMYRVLTMMCTNKASGSSEAGALSDLQDSGKTPSSRWVLGKIRAIDAREIRERCDHAIKREALDMKKAGMFRNPVVVAIDEHLVGWYGKGSDSQYITHSKSKNGTSRFYSLATVHCVAGGSRAALGARLVKKTDNDGDVVSKLLEKCSELRIRSSRVLLDRGFFSVDVIQTLNLHGKAFIMPAIKGPGIKKAIMEHVKEKRPAVSKYTMTSREGYTATFTLVILEKTPEPDEVKKETDRYIVFATNARARSKQDLISKIPDEYKKRWGIETGYACMERIRPRTSSRNDSIRMLLMYLPLVIYNAWIMENYAAGACADGGRPVITLRRLMFRFILIIAVSVLSSRYSHYLEFVG